MNKKIPTAVMVIGLSILVFLSLGCLSAQPELSGEADYFTLTFLSEGMKISNSNLAHSGTGDDISFNRLEITNLTIVNNRWNMAVYINGEPWFEGKADALEFQLDSVDGHPIDFHGYQGARVDFNVNVEEEKTYQLKYYTEDT